VSLSLTAALPVVDDSIAMADKGAVASDQRRAFGSGLVLCDGGEGGEVGTGGEEEERRGEGERGRRDTTTPRLGAITHTRSPTTTPD